MTFKRVWKNKKGFALETAILFMLTISSLCFLLTSVALVGHYDTRLEAVELQRDVTVEQIGEYYIASVQADTVLRDFGAPGTTGYYKGGRYRYTVGNNALRVWNANDGNTVLYVEAERDPNGEVIVSAWKYSAPSESEG